MDCMEYLRLIEESNGYDRNVIYDIAIIKMRPHEQFV